MDPTPIEKIKADLRQRADPKCWTCGAIVKVTNENVLSPKHCNTCKEPLPSPPPTREHSMALVLADQCLKDDERERTNWRTRTYSCYGCGTTEAVYAGYCPACKTQNEIRSAELPHIPRQPEKWMGSRRIEDVDTKGAL